MKHKNTRFDRFGSMAEMAIEHTPLLILSFKIYSEDFDVDLLTRLSCRILYLVN